MDKRRKPLEVRVAEILTYISYDMLHKPFPTNFENLKPVLLKIYL